MPDRRDARRIREDRARVANERRARAAERGGTCRTGKGCEDAALCLRGKTEGRKDGKQPQRNPYRPSVAPSFRPHRMRITFSRGTSTTLKSPPFADVNWRDRKSTRLNSSHSSIS